MPRKPRQKSSTGVYHVTMRGVNRQAIFLDAEDRRKFIRILMEVKLVSPFELLCFCLMGNHVHFLIRETEAPLSEVIKRVSCTYVYWFNNKHERCGHLFQERFRSEPVEDEAYLFTVLHYIIQNPVKAGMVSKVVEFYWSSYHEYLNKPFVTDIDFILNMFSPHREKAVEQFILYVNQPSDNECLEYHSGRPTDKEAEQYLETYGFQPPIDGQALSQSKRKALVSALLSVNGISVRQIVRITGIPKSSVERIIKRLKAVA